MTRVLKEQVLPFWANNSLDREFGGYLVHLDRQGHVYDPCLKFAAMQARMIYAFSIGELVDPQGGYRQMAGRGVEFVLKHFWDTRHGGWFRTVRRNGEVVDGRKHVFDHTYLLIGLCQYYHLTRDRDVLEYLVKTYEILEDKAWDHDHSGYRELFSGDWQVQWGIKTACGQIDALAAMLQLEMAVGGDIYRRKIAGLAEILTHRMRDGKRGFILEHFSREWRYLPASCRDQIEFGHNLKTAVMLMRAYAVLDDATYLKTAGQLVDISLAYGWNADLGGFYQDGYRNGSIAVESLLWWPECEGLLALARLYRLTGTEVYRRACRRLWDCIDRYFYDHEFGEMYTSLGKDGKVDKEEKGGDYKAAFHSVEALYWAGKDMNGRFPDECRSSQETMA